MSDGKLPLARIVTHDGEVHIVADAYRAAGGWSFRQPTGPSQWMSRPRFQSSVRFIPSKRIAAVEEVKHGA
ncbi:MAG: hypothetical protein WCO96_05170 [Actinomycetes bacterium]